MVRCTSYNCNSIRNNSEVLKSLLESSDIVFLQELMLNKNDLDILNTFNEDFSFYAFVQDRDAEGINEGRPKRGVAVFYRKELASSVSPVLVDDRIIGVIVNNDSCKFLFMNVYLPCDLQNADSLHEYRQSLATINDVIKQQNINNVIIVGDFNADPHKGRFWKELLSFRELLLLNCVDLKLPTDTFTYLCPAKSTTSWLDHILCSNHLKQCFSDIYIDFRFAIVDHFPLCFDFNFEINSCGNKKKELHRDSFVNWNNIKESDRVNIIDCIERDINSKKIMVNDALLCTNINCTNKLHIENIDGIFSDLKVIILGSTDQYCFSSKKPFKVIPGWNDHVRELHKIARTTFLLWKISGKPLMGCICDQMKTSRALFKTALKDIKLNENQIRKEK